MKFIFPAFILLLLSSCKTYSDSDLKDFDQKIKKFSSASGIRYEKSESGLYYFIEKQGSGDFIKFTDEVTFTYEGKLLNGKVFDGKYKKKPVTFKVTQLIEGWKEAMLYLKKGGKAKLIVPPNLGYGDYDLDAIPANSILCFTIEIIDVN